MTSSESAFLSPLLRRLADQVPFQITGTMESGRLELGNFPTVEHKDMWVLHSLFEEVSRYCDKAGVTVRAIRFKDEFGTVISETDFG